MTSTSTTFTVIDVIDQRGDIREHVVREDGSATLCGLSLPRNTQRALGNRPCGNCKRELTRRGFRLDRPSDAFPSVVVLEHKWKDDSLPYTIETIIEADGTEGSRVKCERCGAYAMKVTSSGAIVRATAWTQAWMLDDENDENRIKPCGGGAP